MNLVVLIQLVEVGEHGETIQIIPLYLVRGSSVFFMLDG